MAQIYSGTVFQTEDANGQTVSPPVDIPIPLGRADCADLEMTFTHDHTSAPGLHYYLLNDAGDEIYRHEVPVLQPPVQVEQRLLGINDSRFNITSLRLVATYQSTDYEVRIGKRERRFANLAGTREISADDVSGRGAVRTGNIHPGMRGHFFEVVLEPGERFAMRADLRSRFHAAPFGFTLHHRHPTASPFTWLDGVTIQGGDAWVQDQATYVNESNVRQRMLLKLAVGGAGWLREVEYRLNFSTRRD